MPTPTYDLIASTTLQSNTSNVTFTGIPTDGTYRHLVISISGTMAVGSVGHGDMQFNNSTSGYNVVHLSGNGSTAIGRSYTGQSSMRFSEENSFSNTEPNTVIVELNNYWSPYFKTALIKTNRAHNFVDRTFGRWDSTSIINKIVFGGDAAYQTGTIFSIYGVAG